MMLVIGLLLALAWPLVRPSPWPALVAAVMVMAAPLWLVGGFALDLLRKLPAGIRWALLALLRALGVLAVLPLTPFVFVWAFLAELFRPKHQPPARFSQPPNGRPKSSTWPPGVAGSQKQKSRSVEAQKPKNSNEFSG
jgi:hypothetical protein